eukprot:TRINITY_DN9016_c0_g1_i1.p1 TRINITY_DN9016_c0_g1~~TRINITY_DN9016_c0_g1_i1.p1  ORF type:complete len:552 (-),score=175.96 TRINITY_DN9016_c0_g1_i1:4-1659(-)
MSSQIRTSVAEMIMSTPERFKEGIQTETDKIKEGIQQKTDKIKEGIQSETDKIKEGIKGMFHKRTPSQEGMTVSVSVSQQYQVDGADVVEAAPVDMTVPPPKNERGIRILTLDGGGMRGLVVVEILSYIEDLLGKFRPGYKLSDSFDLICGTSTGGILAFAISIEGKSMKECRALYDEMGPLIFNPEKKKKIPIPAMHSSKTFSGLLKRKDNFGEHAKLNEARACRKGAPRAFVVATHFDASKSPAASATVELKTSGGSNNIKSSGNTATPPLVRTDKVVPQPYLFRNYEHPRAGTSTRGSSNHYVWEAVRATTAAPVYFKPYTSHSDLFVDGGLMANNPTMLAMEEALMLWPDVPVSLIVSVGTGIQNLVRPDDVRPAPAPSEKPSAFGDIKAGLTGSPLGLAHALAQSSQGYVAQALAGVANLLGVIDMCINVATDSETTHDNILVMSKLSQHTSALLGKPRAPVQVSDGSKGLGGSFSPVVPMVHTSQMSSVSWKIFGGIDYFRLNPNIETVDLNEVDPTKLSNMISQTQAFIKEAEPALKQLVTLLL